MKIAYVIQKYRPADPDYHPDIDILYTSEAAQRLGIDIEFVDWRDNTVNWSQYAAAVIRSTWDYVKIRQQFVQWAKQVQSKTKLFNSAQIIEWNTQKSYLLQLQKQNIPIVPTKYAHNLKQANEHIQQTLKTSKQIVVKPSIGADACLTSRTNSRQQAVKLVQQILNNNRTAMIQPYLMTVQEEGEKSIMVIDGQITHAVRKVPALTGEEFHIPLARIQVDKELRQFVECVKKNLKQWDQLLYARIDVIRCNGKLVLMELQLTEPSLFMSAHPQSADILLKAILKRIL